MWKENSLGLRHQHILRCFSYSIWTPEMKNKRIFKDFLNKTSFIRKTLSTEEDLMSKLPENKENNNMKETFLFLYSLFHIYTRIIK